MQFRAAAGVMFGVLFACGLSRAEPYELSRTAPETLGIELGASLITATASVLVPSPAHCRWCSPPRFDESIASAFVVEGRRPAAQLSHVLSYSIIPASSLAALIAPSLGGSAPARVALEDVSIGLQAMAWNIALAQLVKKLVARRRPAFHYERSTLTEYSDNFVQRDQSFFSGDTSSAFVLASSVTTLAYLRGYSWAPYAALGGGVLATTTGLLRMAGDVHWASDVLAGAVAGSAVGFLVPWLLHPRAGRESSNSMSRAAFLPEFGGSVTGVSWAAQF